MAKIAVACEAAPPRRELARGEGWSVSEVICSAGPRDRPFEEQHADACVAIVTAGTFQYRSSAGRELMTPGSLLLGNPGQYFECGHEHGLGDRCISFAYEPGYLEEIARDAGAAGRDGRFRSLRVPPVREISPLAVRAAAGSSAMLGVAWDEIAFELAARALELADGQSRQGNLPVAEARVSRVLRRIEAGPEAGHTLEALAREARLSRYHFLRIFQQITGLTPHQYIVRARLRGAARRLLVEPAQVLDIALDSGFGDVSNFNHAFRAEFGISPRVWRRNASHGLAGGVHVP